MSGFSRVLCAVTVFGLLGCGSPGEEVLLPPAERFNWRDQPVRFAPAPSSWRREKTTDGGLFGMRFVKTGSVGEAIIMAEMYRFGDRDRCAEINVMIATCMETDWRQLTRDVSKARFDVSKPVSDDEKYLGGHVNSSMGRALEAVRNGNNAAACQDLETAREQASRIVFSLDDVDEKYLAVFKTGRHVRADQFHLIGRSDSEVAGEPAIRRDYTFEHRGHLFIGRELFVMVNNRVFVMAFHGLEENLPLFEQIVESVAFPPGECRH